MQNLTSLPAATNNLFKSYNITYKGNINAMLQEIKDRDFDIKRFKIEFKQYIVFLLDKRYLRDCIKNHTRIRNSHFKGCFSVFKMKEKHLNEYILMYMS